VTGTETSNRVRPRIRVAAAVWGLVIVTIAASVGWFVLDPARVTAMGLAVATAEPGTIAIGAVGLLLVIGVVIVVGSLLSVVHRAQDRGRTRREDRAGAPVDPGAPTADRT
jgi:hypothetical protein